MMAPSGVRDMLDQHPLSTMFNCYTPINRGFPQICADKSGPLTFISDPRSSAPAAAGGLFVDR
jgi:hypothetical protein